MQITIYVAILFLTIAISITLAIFGFRRYAEPEMAAFGYLTTFIAIWAIGAAGECLFSQIDIRLFWSIILYVGNQSSPPTFLIFILLLTRSGTWFPDKYIPALYIVPACSILMAGTNQVHHLLWTDIRIVHTPFSGNSLLFEHGPWFSFEVAYLYLLLAIGLICIIRSLFSSPGVFNRQMTIIFVASLIPIIGNIMYTSYGEALTGIDLTPILFSCTGILCWYAITRHQLFDIFPALYIQIFKNMQEGVIILDHKSRIIAINPSASTLTNLSESVIGKDAESALTLGTDSSLLLSGPLQDMEIQASDNRWLSVRSYPIPSGYTGKDGRLIIINNISARKKLQKDLENSAENIRRANVKLRLMSGVIRHDIANELMLIKSTLDLITPPKDPDERDFYYRSKEATTNIHDLIKFTKEYEEMGIRKPEWLNLYSLINEEGSIAEGVIRIENIIPAGIMIYTDPLFRTVIRNLIDNAIRHGLKITMIRFYIEDKDGNTELICEDDGRGVAIGEKEKIFNSGYGNNTGMGLFFVREILSVGDMRIIEDGEEGKGARFMISIPKSSIRMNT